MKANYWAAALAVLALAPTALAAPVHQITIDGNMNDWADVPSYTDPSDDQHDTDHTGASDVPAYVNHPDVDLLEFKFTHDGENLYAWFRARGQIANTANFTDNGARGRSYTIVTIDVDQDDETGYPLHEGGYYPTTRGYDLNMEVEHYDGTFNTGHFLLHGCLDDASYAASEAEQSQGLVSIVPGNYDCYTQWVWYDDPPGYPNEIILPSGEAIYWVVDKGPVYPDSIVEFAISADGHSAEMKSPFRGFMRNSQDGTPVIALGKVLDLSFSLEGSGELAPGAQWASDTADPINKYVVGSELAGSNGDRAGHAGDKNDDFVIDSSELLRMIQLYNLGEFSCDPTGEDGFNPGAGDKTCTPHEGDYNPQDWHFDLSEMLRAIQIYNKGGYELCEEGEDGLCLVSNTK
ncbi:MAG: hypothetical protein JNK74_27640 [Candidatus Hydrogenedentes bacterium]|nr:hypothetical protein [Candidatus Hydrogenedentota bacterium]